jgi:hypothetical protein
VHEQRITDGSVCLLKAIPRGLEVDEISHDSWLSHCSEPGWHVEAFGIPAFSGLSPQIDRTSADTRLERQFFDEGSQPSRPVESEDEQATSII